MTTKPTILAPLAALALALGACGGDDAPSAAEPAAATPATSMPYGTYTRTVTKADLDRTTQTRRAGTQEAGTNLELPLLGEYRLVISESKAGDVVDNIGPDDFSVKMYAEAEDGLLRLDAYVDPNQGAFCGPEVDIEASYRFEVEGEALSIEASPPDPCADRDSLLSGTWERQ